MSTIQVLVPSAKRHLTSLVQYLRDLLSQGKSVVLVTSNRPHRSVVERLKEHGVDPDDVFVLDAISCIDGAQPADRPDNVLFLQSPTMLEMIAMRTEQIVGRQPGQVHVVLDSLNSLRLYNGVEPVQEFCHYLANRLRSRDASASFVVLDNAEGHELEARVSSFTDGRVTLEALA